MNKEEQVKKLAKAMARNSESWKLWREPARKAVDKGFGDKDRFYIRVKPHSHKDHAETGSIEPIKYEEK